MVVPKDRSGILLVSEKNFYFYVCVHTRVCTLFVRVLFFIHVIRVRMLPSLLF
jgi:hypothetical protein